MRKAILIVPAIVLLTGCSAFRVHRNGQKVNGIPFYAKTAVCLQQTVYVAPYFRLAFQIVDGDKVLSSETADIAEEVFQAVETQDLLSLVRQKSLEEKRSQRAVDLWSAVAKKGIHPLTEVAGGQGKLKEYKIANTASPEVVVDYQNSYTLNAKAPLAGSINPNVKLASDGTITEASNQVQDQTLATIAGVFPISDLIKSAAKISTTKGAPEARTLQVIVERRAVKITRTAVHKFVPGCAVEGNEVDQAKADFKFEDIGPETAVLKQPDTNAASTVTLEGTIKVPKQ